MKTLRPRQRPWSFASGLKQQFHDGLRETFYSGLAAANLRCELARVGQLAARVQGDPARVQGDPAREDKRTAPDNRHEDWRAAKVNEDWRAKTNAHGHPLAQSQSKKAPKKAKKDDYSDSDSVAAELNDSDEGSDAGERWVTPSSSDR